MLYRGHDPDWAWLNHADGAVLALLCAVLVTVLMTPLVARLARLVGAIDDPSDDRRVHRRPTPRLGGVAVLGGVLAGSLTFVNWQATSPVTRVGVEQLGVVLAIAVLACALGAWDDIRSLNWRTKLAGQLACAFGAVLLPLVLPAVHSVRGLVLVVHVVDPPFLHALLLPTWLGVGLAVLWIVALMNMVNFIDGVDGLAAGTCAICALTFAVIAASYFRDNVAVLAGALCGGALGFLFHNFRRGGANIFLGDAGSMLVGYLLGVISIQGVLKTAAAISLVIPLALLAVPILDTLFVVLKRMKYKLPVSNADRWHLHHRLLNVGYSPRRVAASFWVWTASMSAVAIALRFIDYGNSRRWNVDGLVLLVVIVCAALAVSVYLATTLEIIKRRGVRERNARIAAERRRENTP